MLEHYSHIRLKAKKAALDRLDGSSKDQNSNSLDTSDRRQRERA
jgi:hypothetical protein